MTLIRWLLSLVFILQMYLSLAVVAIVFAPWALFSRRGAHAAVKAFSGWVLFSLRILCGLRVELRGSVPAIEAVIASKHQSFLDIIVLCNAAPKPKFVMKRELIYAPFLGQYALRIGCIPVNRGKRGAAVAKMKADVAGGTSTPGQLIIYPQGTRVAPGAYLPYKIGTGLLYAQLGQPCTPVATNVGLFWPKRGILRKPGVAVVEFLPPIAPGLRVQPFMDQLEEVIETNSNRLMAEAGFKV